VTKPRDVLLTGISREILSAGCAFMGGCTSRVSLVGASSVDLGDIDVIDATSCPTSSEFDLHEGM